MPNESSRSVFTAAVLLLLIAGLEAWVAFSGADLTIGTFPVPQYMSWAVAGVFALVGLMAMRASHLSSVLPSTIGK